LPERIFRSIHRLWLPHHAAVTAPGRAEFLFVLLVLNLKFEIRNSKLQKAAWGSLTALALTLVGVYGYYILFSRFRPWDDEGFVLISIKSMVQGKALYNEVWTCYQPGFYAFNWMLFGLAGLPVSHDSIRWLTLALWVIGAGLNGVLAWRLTGSKFWGLTATLLTARVLDGLSNEPGHPVALAYILVAAVVAAFVFQGQVPRRFWPILLGTLCGMLALTKINIGLYTILPVGMVLLWLTGRRRPWREAAVGLSLALVPGLIMHAGIRAHPTAQLPWLCGLAFAGLLLAGAAGTTQTMRSAGVLAYGLGGRLARRSPGSGGETQPKLAGTDACATLSRIAVLGLGAGLVGYAWTHLGHPARYYLWTSGLIGLAATNVALIGLAHPAEERLPHKTWMLAGAAAALTALVLLAFPFMHGTTVSGLLDGLILVPARQTSVFSLNWKALPTNAWLAVAGSMACYLYIRMRAAKQDGTGDSPADSGRAQMGTGDVLPAQTGKPTVMRSFVAWLGSICGQPKSVASSPLPVCGHSEFVGKFIGGGQQVIGVAQAVLGALILAEFFWRDPENSRLRTLRYDWPHFWMLPFLWLVLAGPASRENRTGRLALLAIASLQPLIAYPIAGTQLVPASLLLVVIGIVCLKDGLQTFSTASTGIPLVSGAATGRQDAIAPRAPWWIRLALPGAACAVVLGQISMDALAGKRGYDQKVSLNLPGAHRLRLDLEDARVYQDITRVLARPEVDTFLSLPGLNSFYFWSQKEPPTGFNTTTWMSLLDEATQEKIWQATKRHAQVMVLRNNGLVKAWTRGRPMDHAPLLQHIEEEFQLIGREAGYQLLERKTRTR
jgi:hypothetical protein